MKLKKADNSPGSVVSWYGEFFDRELENRFYSQDVERNSQVLRHIILIGGLLFAVLGLFDFYRLSSNISIALISRLSVPVLTSIAFIASRHFKDIRKLANLGVILVAYTAVSYMIVAVFITKVSYMMICLSVITFLAVLFLMQAKWTTTNVVAAIIILVFFITASGRYTLNPAEHLASGLTLIAATVVVSMIYRRMCRAKRIQYYINISLEVQNESLEEQVEHRTEILNIVNHISTVLLGSQVETFGNALFSCMEELGISMNVHRVYIWENHMVGDELYCTQIYEWSGEAEPQQGNELTVSVPFPGAWYPNLSVNKCVNGTVDSFPEYERQHLEAQGIVSLIVVPVFLYDKFWGFVGFDDCENVRLFTSAEESILRSASLLFGHAYVRNATTIDLIAAKEEALASAKAKTDFLANMSHEIRTPINAITGMVNIAQRADDKDEVSRCLTNIDSASRQLLSIINDVLDMSKISANKMELASIPFRLDSVMDRIRTIIGAQAAEKKLDFACTEKPPLPEVLIGDDTRLAQVLINLLSNAVKFTPEGGSVSLSAEADGEDENGLKKLRFSVRDTGIGIAAEQISSLFTEFEQADRSTSRKYGGTGLGLSISKRLAELMNGDVEVESEVGAGSCFTLTVSLQEGSPELMKPSQEESAEVQYDFSGSHALLVEDIEINREIAKAMLGAAGLAITEAENGEIALEIFERSPDKFDVIFMDIQMPVLDGYMTTKRLRSLPHPCAKTVPIIAMTANAFAEDVERCLTSGMNDHVSKPINAAELMEKLSRALQQ